MSDGQFDWGGRLLKCNGGAQRFPQNGWKSFVECKGRRELDCETYKSVSYTHLYRKSYYKKFMSVHRVMTKRMRGLRKTMQR